MLGRENINRAVQGDQVVIEILPKDQWKQPSTKIVDEETLTKNDNPEFDAPEAIETEQERKALVEEAKKSQELSLAQPTGRIVGIVKRSWRWYVVHTYCYSPISYSWFIRISCLESILTDEKTIVMLDILTQALSRQGEEGDNKPYFCCPWISASPKFAYAPAKPLSFSGSGLLLALIHGIRHRSILSDILSAPWAK